MSEQHVKLSEVKPDDCITVWYGDTKFMQDDASYCLDECLTLSKGFRLTYMEDTKIKRDITLDKWFEIYIDKTKQ